MQNVLQNGKRALSVAVAAATMLFSVGAGLMQPSVASAASAGDLIKGTSLSTVYYYGYDGMRYTFPNEKTYMTWFSDFSDVTTISDSALADLSLAGNVVYRPGSYWIKVQSSPVVYAVATDGVIHAIDGMTADGGEATAEDYAGSTWNTGIQDVPDVFFTDYTVGSSLMTATAFDGMLYMDGGSYYVSSNGEKRLVSSAGRSANNLQTGFFLSGTGIDDSSLSVGDDITTAITSLTDVAQTEEGDAVTGGVSISLASSTPASATIPGGDAETTDGAAASSVEVATFKVTADEEAILDVMSVTLMGLAATSTINSSGVYLYEGSERLTDGKSFNSSTRKATFSSLNLDFGAGETRYLTVVVDMADAGVTTTFSVGLEAAADVEASGDVSGSFPISGNTMNVVSSTVGSVVITDTGSLTNPVVGANDATISKFKLAAGATEDISFERITLKVNDAADHSDFQLWEGSDWLADGSYIGNKLVMFDLGSSAYDIEKGANRTFTVTADIGGKAAETIDVYLDNSADLYAIGLDYGFGVTVTRTGFDGTAGDVSTTTIQGGDLNVTFSGPAQTDVSSTAENFSLFEGTLTAERDMTITAMPFAFTMVEADSANDSTFEHDPLSDIRLVNADTGALLSGPMDLTETTDGDAAATISFTDDFMVNAGETLNFKVTADVESTADNNDTYTMAMDLTSGLTAEDDNGDAITSIVPGTDLTGNAQRVVTSGLTVSLASTPSGDRSYVHGTSGAEMAAFNFAAASGGDIELTDLTATVYIDADSAGTYTKGTDTAETDVGDVLATSTISTCSLYDGSDLVAGPESVSSATTGDILFQDFSYWIDAGTTATLTVKCNLANVSAGATADQYAVEINESTDVIAKDSENNDATISGTFGINASETVLISVSNSGTLTVNAASDTAYADFLMTGSSDNSVSKFRFDAVTEAFTVNRLTVTEEQAEIDTGVTDSATYANNVSLVTISYPDASGVTQTASGALTGNEITFNGLAFYVGKDSHAEVTVKVNIASTDRSGGSATSNERIRMGLSRDTSNDDQIRAVGSNSTLDDDDIAVATATSNVNKFVVRETKPTITLSSSTPSGTKVPGDQEVLRFNVAAASNEDVVLKNMIFKMSSTDVSGDGTADWNQCDTESPSGVTLVSDFDIYNLSKEGTATALDASSDFTLLKATGAVCDTAGADIGFVKLSLTTAEVIPAGTTYTYSLYFDSMGASVGNDSVQFEITADPITSSYIEVLDGSNDTAIAITDTSIIVDTDATAVYSVGDIIGYDVTDDDGGAAPASSERMLVTAVAATSLTVVRGYLGTRPETYTDVGAADDIYRLPGALLWQDDGSIAVTTSQQEYYGAHLVDSLPATPSGSISF